MTAMQKLLTPATAEVIVERGSTALGGPVVRAADVIDLSPAELVTAHGWAGPAMPWTTAPDHVDVLRFDSDPLMDLRVPGPVGDRPWPTYELGFLPAPTPVPVWLLARTRVPVGTEYWRIEADGRQRQFSFYAGPGVGWSGARGFRPPVGLTGPRARWNGAELPASLTEDGRGVELVALADEAPEGFETTRPGVHRRLVPLHECQAVFEVDLTARWRGAAVRVLQVAGERAQVQLLDPDPDTVARLGAVSLEPGSFEAVAPRAELTDTEGRTRDLPPTAAPEPAEGGVHVGLTMLGQSPDAQRVGDGRSVTTTGPLATSRRASVALARGARGLYAIWSRTGRPVVGSSHPEEAEVVLDPGTSLVLLGTRLVEGIAVHLVVEVDPSGETEPGAVLDDLLAAVRSALEEDEPVPAQARPERYSGDLS